MVPIFLSDVLPELLKHLFERLLPESCHVEGGVHEDVMILEYCGRLNGMVKRTERERGGEAFN